MSIGIAEVSKPLLRRISAKHQFGHNHQHETKLHKTIPAMPAFPVASEVSHATIPVDGASGGADPSPDANSLTSSAFTPQSTEATSTTDCTDDASSTATASAISLTTLDSLHISELTETNTALTYSGSIMLSISGTGSNTELVTIGVGPPLNNIASNSLSQSSTSVAPTTLITSPSFSVSPTTTSSSLQSDAAAASTTGATPTSTHIAPSSRRGLPPIIIGVVGTAVVGIVLMTAVILHRQARIAQREGRRARWMPRFTTRGLITSSFGPGSSGGAFGFGRPSHPPHSASASSPRTARSPTLAMSEQNHANVAVAQRRNSDVSTQYPHSTASEQISVRPFSPSESYRFPKPPSHGDSPSASASSLPSVIQQAPITRVVSDHAGSSSQAAARLSSSAPQDLTTQKFDVVVKRPFVPVLADELYVGVGQKVHVEDVFDDGWALVMRQDGTEGLLPLVCFEESDQDVDLESFIAKHKPRSADPSVKTSSPTVI